MLLDFFKVKGNLPAIIYYSSKDATKNLADSVASKEVYLHTRLNNKCFDLNNLLVLLGIQ